MVKEKKTKRKLKWQVKLFLIILIIILYAFFIGTKGIFIREYSISTNKITNNLDGLKILHISDLHYGSTMDEKDVKKIVEKANETKPDIVIFTGDLINKDYDLANNEKEMLKNKLSMISAELGKYYVAGEEDFEDATAILNTAEFVSLDKNPQNVYKIDNTPILLINESSTSEYFETNDNNYFKIFVTHNPNNFSKNEKYNFDMAIAGHTHNGQINIPKIKDLLIKSKYNKNYQVVNGTKLYISPGLGTSGIKARMFNHPTLNLYRINKTK